ncbi:MAG: hypothetical protein WDA47_03120 [Bacilli bacterium]
MWIVIKPASENKDTLAYNFLWRNEIKINPGLPKKIFATCLAHEIGHLIAKEPFQQTLGVQLKDNEKFVMTEIMASRIAVRLYPGCDRRFLMRCLKTYFTPPGMWRSWTRRACQSRVRAWRKMEKIGIL